MKQLLVCVFDDGTLSMAEIHATVPSGMPVQLSEGRTDQLACPVKIEYEPVCSGKDPQELTERISNMREQAGEYSPWRPWS